MAYQPNLISDFVDRTNDGMLTNIGAGINQVGTRMQAEAAAAEKQRIYNLALSEFMEDPTDLGLRETMYSAGDALGKFDQTKTMIEGLDSQRQTNILQQSGEVYNAVYSGNIPLAIEKLEEQATANENSGDFGEAKELRSQISALKNGQSKEILAYYGGNMGLVPGGKEVIENINAMNADVRAQKKLGIDLMKAGQALKLPQSDLDAIQQASLDDPEHGEIVRKALNYATAVDNGYPSDPSAYNSLITGLNQKFYTRTEGLRNAGISNSKLQDAVLHAQANGTGANGVNDLAIINLFQRQIDEATVRKDDVENIRGAVGLAERLSLMVDTIQKGDALSSEQREEMSRLSDQFLGVQKLYVDDVVYPSLRATQKRLDPEDAAYVEVFGEYKGKDLTPSKDKKEEDADVPVVPPSPVAVTPVDREYLISQWPAEEEDILKLSEEQLRKVYSNTLAKQKEDTFSKAEEL